MTTPFEEALTDDARLVFRHKLAAIEHAVSLGASLETAANAAGCDDAELKEITSRPDLAAMSRWGRAKAELDALKQHHTARAIAAAKGNTAPIQWFLERLNRGAWGTAITVNDDGPIYLVIPEEDAKVV